ncbi:helix-turn-helix domain-containing protein [Nocardia asteroides]|uniref:helix-turn-helix domain-containing protein n=1 Tax=Nocardia asteroides TaxID=1824 RepID=UPI001E44DF12|nr:AraC family transcriptional regulator [Nocardia asteroides]UGT63107.1 AraC family transcriptional regulator [Nocardia asteroides]
MTASTIWLWPGRAAYLGPALRLDAHSTAVPCYAVGVDAPFHLTVAGVRRRVRGARIPPRTVHRIEAGAGRMFFDYRIAGTPGDPRIAEVLLALLADPSESPGAAGFAAAAGLSTSRFLHLFAAQTGTSFRRYRLWARMLRAGRGLAVGNDLTRAAADAGFASPSHFSDSFRVLFGLTASTLLAAGTQIVIVGERPAVTMRSVTPTHWAEPVTSPLRGSPA